MRIGITNKAYKESLVVVVAAAVPDKKPKLELDEEFVFDISWNKNLKFNQMCKFVLI